MGWRARAAVEAPSHLHRHPEPLTLTLLAALLHQRELGINDTLVELLIATMHRIGARAERRVTNELINAFKKVTGKENILFSIAEAALAQPDEVVREVAFPAVTGGEETLRELVHELRRRGRCTGAPYRPRCAPPTPGTTGAAWSRCWRCWTSAATTPRTRIPGVLGHWHDVRWDRLHAEEGDV